MCSAVAGGGMARRARILGCVAVIAGAVLSVHLAGATADGVALSTCNQARWCTVTASGIVTSLASQLAIGNVEAGTPLAVTQNDVKHRQLGGQILRGSLSGTCAWSQYARDWTALHGATASGCADPVHNTSEYVAANGSAIWSGCYPRCFGGVPLRFDPHCGEHGRTFCYRRNCEEYANFYPWSPDAHPADPLRSTQRHQLDLRYQARYPNTHNQHPFYLVRDIQAIHGRGNWVFVSAVACAITAGHTGAYHTQPHHQ